jgi:predicted DCC family thiol-disulfide oxidoreductase YuxK
MATTNTSSNPTQIFYDGQCPLCSREARLYQSRDTLHRLHFINIAAPDFHAPAFGLDPLRVTQVMHSRTPDGILHTQLDAFRTIWRALPPSLLTRLPLILLAIPGMLPLANLFYRLFAKNRHRLTGRCTPESCDLHSASAQTRAASHPSSNST